MVPTPWRTTLCLCVGDSNVSQESSPIKAVLVTIRYGFDPSRFGSGADIKIVTCVVVVGYPSTTSRSGHRISKRRVSTFNDRNKVMILELWQWLLSPLLRLELTNNENAWDVKEDLVVIDIASSSSSY
jgi:hypothetical protein